MDRNRGVGFVTMMAGGGSSNGNGRVRKVVVVGGGIIGASSAYFLSKRGVEVEVLESNGVACAASGKAGGFLALDWNDEGGNPVGPLSRASFSLHKELAHEFGPDAIGYRPISAVAANIPENARHEAKKASYLRYVSRETVIGTTETCAQVHPERLTKALMRGSRATVTIAKVIGINHSDSEITSLRIEGGATRPISDDEMVVFALGPWSNLLSKELGLPAFYGQKALSMVVPTDPPLSPYASFTNWRGKSPEIYPRADEAYVCGFGESLRIVTEGPDQVVPLENGERQLRAFTKEILGSMGDDVAVRACHLPLAEDGIPVIGSLESNGAKNGVLATGHSCWGILNGPATGKVVSELICDGDISLIPKWAVSSFSPARFDSKTRSR
uniref:FAD dependent oxidoreductase domain-containing protein n=1 Tax=Rhodosorus marinus TaxID=101924 RepID=A0A7S2ZH87_9RHOD|mmetsp:Transcript_18984/g.76159  ORF Transcript_18984/g.76159 Transcript_18984/m.76159 type:complete len:386 (+) Transcript_18984:610-1767(+)